MVPYLYRTPWFFIYSFTAVLGIGTLFSLGLTARLNQQFHLSGWIDGWLAAMAGAVIGGRIGFIWASWSYYQERPSDLGLWQGGLSYDAALFTGLLFLWGYCRQQKRPLHTHLHLFAPALALIHAFGWAACWLEGCAYGTETTLGPLAADLPDTFGVFAVRYQTQVAGGLWSLLFFGIALWQIKRGRTATLFWLTLFGLSLGRMGISLLRGDAVAMIGRVRIDTLFNSLVAFISLILLQYHQRKKSVN